MPRTHLLSHWLSCGHTRPQTAGRAEVSLILAAASINLPSATRAINSGILTPTGQPATQGLCLQFKQR